MELCLRYPRCPRSKSCKPSSAGFANYLTAIRESMAKAEAAYAGSHFSVDQPLWRETLNYLDQALLSLSLGDRQVLVSAIEIYEEAVGIIAVGIMDSFF
ncbi:MAG: hypothetical protein R2865_10790 [Deinococcales bacterium]